MDPGGKARELYDAGYVVAGFDDNTEAVMSEIGDTVIKHITDLTRIEDTYLLAFYSEKFYGVVARAEGMD